MRFNVDIDGDLIRRRVTERLLEKFRDQPLAFEKLVRLGIVDADLLGQDPNEIQLAAVFHSARNRLSELAAEAPSVLSDLEVRPLDMLAPPESGDDAASNTGTEGLEEVRRTVVFSDLEGFTAFTSEHGDREASALLSDHYDTVDAIVRSRGGAVVKTIGDGHMLSFTEPAAAVMSAVEMADAAPGALRVRVGAHIGRVLRSTDDLLGHVVNVAARVTELAGGGATVVTVDLRDAAGRLPKVVFDEPHEAVLAGIPEPQPVCGVTQI